MRNWALHSDFLTQGPKIAEFEQAFAEYIGCKYAVAVSNGTGSIAFVRFITRCRSSYERNNDSNYFAASANCIRYCGGNIFFADIDRETYCLDIEKVKDLIRSKPKGFFKGIIPVDFAGYPINMEEYKKLAEEHDLW
jgi:dTDP-4-amino-4,6-dideoxygalactose transaminase